MGYYKTILKEQGKKIKKEKQKKKVDEVKEMTNRYSLNTFPRKEILEIILTQGSLPKNVFRILPTPLKRKFQLTAKDLVNHGYILEEDTDNGKVFTLIKKGNEETLSELFGDEALVYYNTFVVNTETSDERDALLSHANSAKTRAGIATRARSKRAYGNSLVRSLMYFANIDSTVRKRGILHFEKDVVHKSPPKYYSRFEVFNDIKVSKYEELYVPAVDTVRHELTANTRNLGLLVSEGDIYSCYCPNKELLRWYHSSEKIQQQFLGIYCKYRFGTNRVVPLHFVASNNIILRILENDARVKIMQNLLYADGLKTGEMYALPISEEGISHLKEMTEKNWKNRSLRNIGVTFEEVKEAELSSIACDAVRTVDGRQLFILNYCIPNLVKLKAFSKACKTEKLHKTSDFVIYCYPYQRELIDAYIGTACNIVEVEQMQSSYQREE